MADNGKIIRNGAEIQIDENGNVVARPAAGQEFIVEDDARVGTLEADTVSTEEQDITNETLVQIQSLGSDQSISQNDDNVIEFGSGNVVIDERGEFDTDTHTFSPDKTGYYRVDAQVRRGSGSDGDRVWITILKNGDRDVKNPDNDSQIEDVVDIGAIVRLEDSDDLQIAYRNRDSSDEITISGDEDDNRVQIRSVFRED